MAKGQSAQVLTANRLRSGDVVYWQCSTWVAELADAEVFLEPARADEALTHARQFVTDRVVVNPYLFAIEIGDRPPRPIEEREIIRADGPTVRADTGKQAARHV